MREWIVENSKHFGIHKCLELFKNTAWLFHSITTASLANTLQSIKAHYLLL